MRAFALLFLAAIAGNAEDDAAGRSERARAIRDWAGEGAAAIPKIEPYLEDGDAEVRWEAVRAISQIGTPASIEPLIKASRDTQPAIQIRATDGLVNFYLPGHLKTGWATTFRKAGTAIKGRFTDTNTDVVPPHVTPREDVVDALGKLARGASSMEARANAARALGILRGRPALPDLYEALKSRNSLVLYESLIAIQKIREIQAGPRFQFLLRDLDEKVRIAAIETTGILQNRAAMADLGEALERARSMKVKRAALTALAMMPDEQNREIFGRYFSDQDDGLRGAAAEGYARLRAPGDLPALERAFQVEKKTGPRLSAAFAIVMLGKHEWTEGSALAFLLETLNSKSYRDSAQPLLIELARQAPVRHAIYSVVRDTRATKEQKIRLAQVLGESGDADSLPVLESLGNDADPAVAQEGVRAAGNLRARLP